MEKEKDNSIRNKRSDLIFKRVIFTAIALTVISFIMTIVVVKTVGKENSNTTTVVAPKLVGQSQKTPELIQSNIGRDPLISNLIAHIENNVTNNKGVATQPEGGNSEAILPDSSPGQPDGAVVNEEENTKKPAKTTKVVYLTFDDGPSKYTQEILDILEEKGVHATFFMIGNNLSGNESKVKSVHEAGNYVGLHSMSHSKKILYDSGSSKNFINEYTKEQGLIKKIIGTTPVLIRAPYGSQPAIGKKFRDDIAGANFKMWDWTVDSKDWNYPHSPDKIMKEIKRQVHRNTEVILMHEKAQTVSVLADIIDYLSKKGYSFAVYKPDQHISVNFAKDERL
ncbi:polysaccharide deacetylase family protein [Paenibacillus segetis]|nr:polysaccharide deacetylase family protein [Paenibacillus segetis]